jgi:hypothetical protein
MQCGGELPLDQQWFQDAVEKFDKLFELEKSTASTSLLFPSIKGTRVDYGLTQNTRQHPSAR